MSNPKIGCKEYCLKLYNFCFNQAKLKLPMGKILDKDMIDDDVYLDIWRDVFTVTLYEVIEENLDKLNMFPTPLQDSWIDWSSMEITAELHSAAKSFISAVDSIKQEGS